MAGRRGCWLSLPQPTGTAARCFGARTGAAERGDKGGLSTHVSGASPPIRAREAPAPCSEALSGCTPMAEPLSGGEVAAE